MFLRYLFALLGINIDPVPEPVKHYFQANEKAALHDLQVTYTPTETPNQPPHQPRTRPLGRPALQPAPPGHHGALSSGYCATP